MFKVMEGLPQDVVGIEATGKVTHADYRDTLIPIAESAMGQGRAKMLFVAGEDMTGISLEAVWDDAAFGLRHWRDVSQVAIVTDHAWLRGSATLFTPFFPGEVRVFSLSDLAAAKAWITAAPPDLSTEGSVSPNCTIR